MCQVLNMSFSEYCMIVNISRVTQGLPVFINMTGSEYASECNYRRVLNIPRSRISQISAYASVTQGFECTWIWPNNAWINCCEYDEVLNMSDQSFRWFWIYQLFWICQSSEYDKILNMRELLRVLIMPD